MEAAYYKSYAPVMAMTKDGETYTATLIEVMSRQECIDRYRFDHLELEDVPESILFEEAKLNWALEPLDISEFLG
jgi:hypothetical protein